MLKSAIKSNAKLKKIIHWMLIPSGEARPRIWVSWLVNPFIHKKKRGSKIRWQTRLDVLPFNNFTLGYRSVIENYSTINNGVGDVAIGDDTLVGMSNVIIGPVSIGNNVIIAQNVVMSGLNHQYQDVNLPISKQPVSVKPIVIEDDCWIAANAVITAGVTIGRHSVVAAAAVVTKNVAPFSIVAGNPAIVIKSYDQDLKKWIKV